MSPKDESKKPDFIVVSSSDDLISSSSVHDAQIPLELASLEQRAVARSRYCVIIILILAVTSVVTSAVLLINDEEEKDFEAKFRSIASELGVVATESTASTLDAFSDFALAVTSNAEGANASWPFVSIPHFGARAHALMKATKVSELSFAPLVESYQRSQWEEFIGTHVTMWWEEEIYNGLISMEELEDAYVPEIHGGEPDYRTVRGPGPSLPVWYHHPLHDVGAENRDLFQIPAPGLNSSVAVAEATLKPVINYALHDDRGECEVVLPILDSVYGEQKMAGILWMRIDWLAYFQDILPEGTESVVIVLENSCSPEVYTYVVKGQAVSFVGPGDLHDGEYGDMEYTVRVASVDFDDTLLPPGKCGPQLWLHMYPTEELEDSVKTNHATVYALIVMVIFGFTTFVLGMYDYYVKQRQRKYLERVTRQDKIVANVFPIAFRDRLYGAQFTSEGHHDPTAALDLDFLGNSDISGSPPLAEFFPSVTVVFADICGFTAWASTREPPQVFILLEIIYGAFDKIARKLGVFKVETVGDCYVAVVGIPEPEENHAVVGAIFAREILDRMNSMLSKLEVMLGPDTAELNLRLGMNSGQVTAGVLRGERARIQLFGDTMNTASRMESTGRNGCIQIASETARLLRESGKSDWVIGRDKPVHVKGKGATMTCWLRPKVESTDSSQPQVHGKMFSSADSDKFWLDSTGDATSGDEASRAFSTLTDSKTERLVAWNVEVLCALLQQIVAAREVGTNAHLTDEEEVLKTGGGKVLDEFKPIIELKRFQAKDLEKRKNARSIELGVAKDQLRNLLTVFSQLYRENPFHNFAHASHVTSSVRKLLTRIVSVDDTGMGLPSPGRPADFDLVDLAGHSYGITSDPLTQFAVAFSAVIHDLDHPGVPNVQLVAENTVNARRYEKSIAEQNSVVLAWKVLMRKEYAELRSCIYSTEDELRRFRQLVVNTVMATDIADKELQALRKSRWETAFSENAGVLGEGLVQAEDRKATIVIEHLIQASDVAHTMQHWHVYKRWNQRLFAEAYSAYQSGRAPVDPSIDWYKSEIGFFDFYVIPLAKKLSSCGVFGVSSDEYLSYAKANREEWVRKGEGMVNEYVEKYEGSLAKA